MAPPESPIDPSEANPEENPFRAPADTPMLNDNGGQAVQREIRNALVKAVGIGGVVGGGMAGIFLYEHPNAWEGAAQLGLVTGSITTFGVFFRGGMNSISKRAAEVAASLKALAESLQNRQTTETEGEEAEHD